VKRHVPETRCVSPDLADLAVPFCFGDATESQRQAFELHLMECDACWQEVRRLEQAVGVLRADMSLVHTLTPYEISRLLGMSVLLERPFGGHARHAGLIGVLYALLYALPVLVEFAYAWDRYGRIATIAAPIVFAWMLGTTLLALAVCVRDVRAGRGGFLRALLILAGASAVYCGVFVSFAPKTPLVEASFQTWPVNLAFVKSTFHAWLVAPLFMLWSFHFVVLMQKQLTEGRYRRVLGLLVGQPEAVPPPGGRYLPVWLLVVAYAGIFIYNLAGLSHLLDNLIAGPYTNLFIALLLARVAVWLVLPALCIWWYQGALDDLKRECLAATAFDDSDAPDTPGDNPSRRRYLDR
jgi:hypothetical protein